MGKCYSNNGTIILWNLRAVKKQQQIKYTHICERKCESVSHSVVSNSLWPHGLKPTRSLCPWDSPDKNTGVGCHFLLQGIFPTQGLNLCLCVSWTDKQILYCWATRDAHMAPLHYYKIKQQSHTASSHLLLVGISKLRATNIQQGEGVGDGTVSCCRAF